MAADTLPVMSGVLRDQRRSLTLWGLALAAVSAMYISFYPAMGGAEMDALIENLPDAMVTAMGYDRISSPGGYITSTVYGLIAPAGLRHQLGRPSDRRPGRGRHARTRGDRTGRPAALYAQRLAALWVDVLVLVTVVGVTTFLIVLALDMEVGITEILAGTSGLLLLMLGFGMLALAIGAITGRRAAALGAAAALAVLSFILDAIGPTVNAEWMTAVSPFSWYLGNEPLIEGFDVPGLLRPEESLKRQRPDPSASERSRHRWPGACRIARPAALPRIVNQT